MKKKLTHAGIFCLLLLTMFSCKKEWVCTCTAQTNIAGQSTLIEKDTIPLTEKPTAQADCDRFCTAYFNNGAYTNQTETVTQY